MRIKRNLKNIVLSGALALGMSGCFDMDQTEYHYNGVINEEKVQFYEATTLENKNVLKVTKDQRIIYYVDSIDNDLKLDYIVIRENDINTKYINDPAGKAVLAEGQIQFDTYLRLILKTKEAKGLKDLKS